MLVTESCSSQTFISKSPDTILLLFTILFSFFGLLGTILNIGVIYLFLRWNLLRSSIDKLYFSLTISNLCITTIFTFMKIMQIHFKEHCGVNIFGRYVGGILPVTSTSVAVISYAQYKYLKSVHTLAGAVVRNQHQKPDTCWLILISWCSPIFLILSLAISMLAMTIVGFFFFLCYYAAFLLCYRLVVKQLMYQYKQGRDLNLTRDERANVCTLHKESTELVGLIIMNSFLCSLPMLVFDGTVCLLQVSKQPLIQSETAVLSGFAQLFYVINSFINPLLYYYKHRDLRKATIKTLRRTRTKIRPMT